MLRPGPPRWAASTLALGFPFDGAPRSCVEVFGEYRLTKTSFGLALFAPLPGELNKVVMDGTDLDGAHARIYLTRDDCRFEFTNPQFAMDNRSQFRFVRSASRPKNKCDLRLGIDWRTASRQLSGVDRP
jgi:hypothetical protein